MNQLFKNLFLLMATFMVATAFAACGDDADDDGGGGTSVTEVKLSKTSLEFGHAGGSETVSVQSNSAVSASTSATDWLQVSVGEQSAMLKVTPVRITAFANSDGDDRSATVSITADGVTRQLAVTQTAADALVISAPGKQRSVGAEGGTLEVQLRANGDYTVTPSSAWVTVLSTRASMHDGVARLSVAANGGGERSATVEFRLGSVSETVAITQQGKSAGGITADARQTAKAMFPGWNLGNTLEGGNQAHLWTNGGGLAAETAWQQTMTTQQIIDFVKAQGFKSVRVPAAWVMGHITDKEQLTIDPAWMDRVQQVVDYCIGAGLYVLLNDHWDGGWLENSFSQTDEATVEANATRLAKLWTQIATRFRDYDEHLLFAGLNEPACDNQTQTNVLLRYEQAFIDAVRATGGNNAQRTLVVQGPSTDIDKTDSYFNLDKLTDTATDRLIVEVHYYTPWTFCGLEEDASWGKMAYYWGTGNTVSGSQRNVANAEAQLKNLLQKMKTRFVDRGTPVIIGEYGCLWRSVGSSEDQEKHNASVKAFHREVCQQAGTMGMVPMVWGTNYCNQQGTKGSMTIINRATLSVWNQHAMDGISEGVAAAQWPY